MYAFMVTYWGGLCNSGIVNDIFKFKQTEIIISICINSTLFAPHPFLSCALA